MYDTVIGNNPNEHGLNDVHNPAVYSIRIDFIDSNVEVVVAPVDVVVAEGMTVLASEEPTFCALNIISSNPNCIAVVVVIGGLVR